MAQQRTLFKDYAATQRSRIENDEKRIQEVTALHLKCMEKDSQFFPQNPSALLPNFSPSELELEKVIGMGQFGVVLEVTAIYNDRRDGGSRLWRSHRNLLPPTPSSVDDGNSVDTPRNMNMNTPHTVPNVKELLEKSQEIVHCSHARRQSLSEQQQQQQQETMRKQQLLQSTSGTSSFDTNSSKEEDYIHDLRNYMSLHYLRKSDGVPRYAVKQIRKDLYPKKKVEAAVELAREAYLLGCLHHAHIIQLKATVSVPGHVDFMIVLERLSNGTLYDKLMVEWKAAQVQVSSSSGGGRFLVNLWLQHNNSNTNKNSRRHNIANITHTLLMDRLMALYDLSNALAYLHSKMIVFRDLKPENVAFDRRNTVQIFDFGLAKECKPVDLMQAPDGYQMTGMTGTLRIMAPEVIANTHYGLSSDVYSFGILLWEVFACEPAHLEMDFGSHVELVVHQNVRPRRLAQGIIPDRVQYLAEECWSADPSKRPSFEDIQRRLEAEIIHVNGSLPDRSRHLRSPPPELPISTAASPKRNSMKDTIVIGVDGELAVVGVAVKQ